MTASFPVVSIVNAPVLILAVYMLLNTLSAIFWARIMRHDRKYAMWENQDNKSSSFSIAVISFVFSYRFELICFSKLVHA